MRRNFARRLETDLFIPIQSSASVELVRRALTDLRATPAAYDASEGTDNDELRVFGFYRDWELTHESANHATGRVRIEGMT